MSLQRVLYVSSEIAPFLETSLVASSLRKLPEAMQHKQVDVRIIVPKFGIINDRMNRLHEVLRLSGTALSIDGVDYAVTVKVSTIPNTRLQVYFIDNSDLFGGRKAVFQDDHHNFFEDNGLRMIFFCMGVMETLKKLEWEADIVHCHDWITSLLPLFWKQLYKCSPLFSKAKLVTTLYSNALLHHFPTLAHQLSKIGIAGGDCASVHAGSMRSVVQLAMQYSDLVLHGENVDMDDFKGLFTEKTLHLIQNDSCYSEDCFALYGKLLDFSSVVQ